MISQNPFASRSVFCSSQLSSWIQSHQCLFDWISFDLSWLVLGHSQDSTHTEPWSNRLSSLGNRTFAEFVTTALQHNPIGQGRFRGLLLCAAIETQQAATAEAPTDRRVCKLLCKQCLLVVQWQFGHSPLCLLFYRLRQLVSNSQQHPSRVVTTSLCYRSDIPSLRTPMSRSRASKQLSDATLFFGSNKWQHKLGFNLPVMFI